MSATLRKIDAARHHGPSAPGHTMKMSTIGIGSDDTAAGRPLSGRALRNWLIVANVAAWLVIIVAIRLLFF